MEERRLAEAPAETLDTLGYESAPDESLTPSAADLAWLGLQLDSTRMNLRIEQRKHRAAVDELHALRDRLDRLHHLLWEERDRHAVTRRDMAELRRRLNGYARQHLPSA